MSTFAALTRHLADRSVDLHGKHFTDTEAYAIVAVLAFFFVLSLIRKLIVLAVVAAVVAGVVLAYHQGAFN